MRFEIWAIVIFFVAVLLIPNANDYTVIAPENGVKCVVVVQSGVACWKDEQ